jgi:class 3 adenylate cyclase
MFAAALFADFVGSAALLEHEDPEVMQAVLSRAFDRLAEEIELFGGLLEKFMGDAILAVFGVPTAHEDDPERAIRPAIEMQALLGELNRTFATEKVRQAGRGVLQGREESSACRWASLAGDRSSWLWRHTEAFRWYASALDIGERLLGAGDPMRWVAERALSTGMIPRSIAHDRPRLLRRGVPRELRGYIVTHECGLPRCTREHPGRHRRRSS